MESDVAVIKKTSGREVDWVDDSEMEEIDNISETLDMEINRNW